MSPRTVLLIFSAAYLLIEMQAWVFLSQIYFGSPTAESLSEYERFGYASTGLGITLFFVKCFFSKTRSHKHAAIAIAGVPFIYLVAIWSVYEFVHQSPSWIPDRLRPQAIQASIQTLSNPQWSNLWAFYMAPATNKQVVHTNIKVMLKKYPTPDNAVQAAYIQSFRALTVFDEHYQKSAEMLDPSLWPLLWQGANRIAQSENPSQMNALLAERRLIQLQHWISKNAQMPHRWINNEIAFWWMSDQEPVLQSVLFPDRVGKNHRAVTMVHYIEQSREAKAWNALGQDTPGWPAYNTNDTNTYTQFRRALSQSTLSPYAHLPETELPYATGGENHRKQQAYLLTAEQIAPFLFDKSGKPLITLNAIYDLETRARYINTLKAGLPPVLRSNWSRYQEEALLELAFHSDAWKEPTTANVHESTLRAGVITPVLLIISSVMLLLNLLSMARANIVLSAFMLPAALAIALQSWDAGSAALLKAVLLISVRESQIFLS